MALATPLAVPPSDAEKKPIEPRNDNIDEESGYRQPSPQHARRRGACWTFILVLACLSIGFFLEVPSPEHWLRSVRPCVRGQRSARPKPLHHHHSRAASSGVLEDFQVYPPVLTVTPEGVLEITDGSSNASVAVVDPDRPSCQQTLVSYSFANSYGAPFVGSYTPPDCAFNRVSWNLTVTAAGVQFDRLGIVYLGNVEVFRTSTAEPTEAGVRWVYIKDMTPYVSLFKQPQELIFDLGNIVDSTYTAPYNVTLTAAYFNADDSIVPADVIIPISARHGAEGKGSTFSLPPDNATNSLTLPRNIQRAVVSLAATGQINEEFWWSNVPQSAINTFPAAGSLLGYSPFREVQLFIDGTLAGVAWPFPVIFTGGVVPGLWRPIVGIDAFDLKEYEVDITPWLPLLCDGNPHSFTIKVAGLNDNGHGEASLAELVGSYWLVTGKVFVWLDTEGHVTTGTPATLVSPAPDFGVSVSTTKAADGTNLTLSYEVTARRTLSASALVITSKGVQTAFWEQSLTYSNDGVLTDQGNDQVNTQLTSGFDISSSGYATQYKYPLFANSTYTTFADGFSIGADVARSKDVQTVGASVFPTGLESFSATANAGPLLKPFQGASLATTQNGTAVYVANETAGYAYSYGTDYQQMTFSGAALQTEPVLGVVPVFTNGQELFSRQVQAVNATVLYDHELLTDEPIGHFYGSSGGEAGKVYALSPLKPRYQF